MNSRAIFIVIDKSTNPLKGILSYYNFYLNGEISRLIYENHLSLNEKNKIVIYKNEESKLLPEKFIFMVNFEKDVDKKIKEVRDKLKINHSVIVR